MSGLLGRKSSIVSVSNCFDAIRRLDSVSTAQAGKVLHTFILALLGVPPLVGAQWIFGLKYHLRLTEKINYSKLVKV